MIMSGIIRPEGFPDLVKVGFLGDTILIDYTEGSIAPVGPAKHSPQIVVKYLIWEGFIIPEIKEETN